MSIYQIVITCVFAVMTVLGFVVMGIDKAKAKEGKWRIKEAALFAFAILFGGVGTDAWNVRFPSQDETLVFCGIFPYSRPCRYCALCRRNVLSQMIASAISCVLSVKHTQNATRFVCLKKL